VVNFVRYVATIMLCVVRKWLGKRVLAATVTTPSLVMGQSQTASINPVHQA